MDEQNFRPRPADNYWKIKELTSDAEGYVSYVYKLGISPGNNYRVAVALSEEAIKKLTFQANPGEGHFFVPADDNQVTGFKGRLSGMLTVWRRLHIERDSMRAPQGNENKVVGKITRIETLPDDSMKATVRIPSATGDENLVNSRVYVQEQNYQGLWINDLSINLDSPTVGNGRFENGAVFIGAENNGVTTGDLKGNGVDSIHTKTNQKFVLPFVLTKLEKPTVQRQIVGLVASTNNSTLTVAVTGDALTVGDYAPEGEVSAQIAVAGQQLAVAGNAGNQIFLQQNNIEFDFVLQDDDGLQNSAGVALLPHLPVVGNSVVEIYKQVYIIPIVDGGGNPANNKNNVEFRRNISLPRVASALPGGFESKNSYSGLFWTINLLTVYQSGTFEPIRNRSDRDSSSEGAIGAFAEMGGLSSVMCREDYCDAAWVTNDDAEQRVWAHEIGHLFGLPDRYNGDNENFGPGNIMSNQEVSTDFLNRDKSRLRSRRPGVDS